MSSYQAPGAAVQFTVNATDDPPELIYTGDGGSHGWRVYNDGPGTALLYEIRSDEAAPELADILTTRKFDFTLAPGATVEGGGRTVKVYAVAETDTAVLTVRPLKGS